MRQSKFTEAQIVAILKEADATRSVNEIWRHYGISSAIVPQSNIHLPGLIIERQSYDQGGYPWQTLLKSSP